MEAHGSVDGSDYDQLTQLVQYAHKYAQQKRFVPFEERRDEQALTTEMFKLLCAGMSA